ncbi:Fumarylacetoacetase 1 [Colletotrichum chlorophyti]|uniref:Fumarylacetoacetase n=1 Tax=Colletotrichum chlorophyti TaxID=708187 RepID=A0A1Q8S6M6_9PEZI|nr:Fumarylacetoacetase 1 [Colletotrichum chlorophyti]
MAQPTLNAFAAIPQALRSQFRKDIQALVQKEDSPLWQNRDAQSSFIVQRADANLHLPMHVGGFTDFMCAYEHVEVMGALSGHGKVPSNFYSIPLAYNGRASSVAVSGTPVTRPWGHVPTPDGPKFQPSQKLDFEVEMGIFISKPLATGDFVSAVQAHDHIFGLVLLNDWSARDIQFYEMVPLGPFNGKAFGTSISPWVVTLDALEEAGALIAAEPSDLPGGKWTTEQFLSHSQDISIQVTTYLSSTLGEQGRYKSLFAQSNLKHLHWSPFQMVAHQSSAGCGLDSGDLLGTGTMSSTAHEAQADGVPPATGRSGCLQEATKDAEYPIQLGDGVQMTWLEDGDEVIMEAWAGSGKTKIGFGDLCAKVLPAKIF